MSDFDTMAYQAATQELIDVIGLDTSDEEAVDRAWAAGWGYPCITRAQMLKTFTFKRDMDQGMASRANQFLVEQGAWTQEQANLEAARFIRRQQAGYAAWSDGWRPEYPDRFTFTLDSGRLHVGDSCWSHGPELRPEYRLDLPAADGTWTATWTGTGDLMMNTPDGPELDWLLAARIGTFTALHESVTDLGELREVGEVVVEAGQIVIADAVSFDARMAGYTPDQSGWLEHCNEPMVLARDRSGMRGVDAELDGTGVSVSVHDSTYEVQAHLDEQGRTLGIHLVLIDLKD